MIKVDLHMYFQLTKLKSIKYENDWFDLYTKLI
jgi:hypothetical protein